MLLQTREGTELAWLVVGWGGGGLDTARGAETTLWTRILPILGPSSRIPPGSGRKGPQARATPPSIMFSRRSKKKDSELSELKSQIENRAVARLEPPDRRELRVSLEPWEAEGEVGEVGDCLILQLEPPLERPVRGLLVDLCIQGACVRVARTDIPMLEANHVVGMRIAHPTEGWEVLTPAMVRLIKRDEESSMSNVGVEFVNPGQLYAQLQDELGRYFNRRNSERVQIKGDQLKLRIKVRGTRIPAKVFDVSTVGLGVWVDMVLSAGLSQGDEVRFALELPGVDQLVEGSARVARKVPEGKMVYLGLQFDVSCGSELTGVAAHMRRFVDGYLDERLRRSA